MAETVSLPSEAALVVREQPILFSAPMVRALLAGTKTQTRRVVKPQPGQVAAARTPLHPAVEALCPEIRCPYGVPGDRLWVRETLRRDKETGAWFYAADETIIEMYSSDPR